MNKTVLIALALIIVLLIGGFYFVTVQKALVPATEDTGASTTGLANPASTNCVTLGGSLEIRDEASGQVGFCHLKDGRVCEEWALFRTGECKSE